MFRRPPSPTVHLWGGSLQTGFSDWGKNISEQRRFCRGGRGIFQWTWKHLSKHVLLGTISGSDWWCTGILHALKPRKWGNIKRTHSAFPLANQLNGMFAHVIPFWPWWKPNIEACRYIWSMLHVTILMTTTRKEPNSVSYPSTPQGRPLTGVPQWHWMAM